MNKSQEFSIQLLYKKGDYKTPDLYYDKLKEVTKGLEVEFTSNENELQIESTQFVGTKIVLKAKYHGKNRDNLEARIDQILKDNSMYPSTNTKEKKIEITWSHKENSQLSSKNKNESNLKKQENEEKKEVQEIHFDSSRPCSGEFQSSQLQQQLVNTNYSNQQLSSHQINSNYQSYKKNSNFDSQMRQNLNNSMQQQLDINNNVPQAVFVDVNRNANSHEFNNSLLQQQNMSSIYSDHEQNSSNPNKVNFYKNSGYAQLSRLTEANSESSNNCIYENKNNESIAFLKDLLKSKTNLDGKSQSDLKKIINKLYSDIELFLEKKIQN